MKTVRYDLMKLREGSLCLTCGQRATRRVDATVADHVHVDHPTLPLCESHAKQDSRRFVTATVVGGVAKFTPLVAGYSLGRYADITMGLAMALTLGVAGLSFAIERALAPRIRPLCKIVAREDDHVTIEVIGEPPADFLPGGPPTRPGNRVVDRTEGRVILTGSLALIAALVAGWQWTQARPLLWLHNPTTAPATVTIDGDAHTLTADAKLGLRLRAAKHQVVIRTANQTLELPLLNSWGTPMLLATEPACYAIGQTIATTMHAEGQLFTLGDGAWRQVACGSLRP